MENPTKNPFDSRRVATNPYAVTAVTPDRENRLPSLGIPSRRTNICLFLIYASWPLLVAGAAVAWKDIETIVFSGPIMFCIGLVLTWLTRSKSKAGEMSLSVFRWFGVACIGYPIFVFLTIFVCQWSPTDAQIPIGTLNAVVVVPILTGLIASLMMYRSHSHDRLVRDNLDAPTELLTQHTEDPLRY